MNKHQVCCFYSILIKESGGQWIMAIGFEHGKGNLPKILSLFNYDQTNYELSAVCLFLRKNSEDCVLHGYQNKCT